MFYPAEWQVGIPEGSPRAHAQDSHGGRVRLGLQPGPREAAYWHEGSKDILQKAKMQSVRDGLLAQPPTLGFPRLKAGLLGR
jgi:hypothetical protein